MIRRAFLKTLAGAAAAIAVPVAIVKRWLPIRNLNTGKEYETLHEAVADLPPVIDRPTTILLKPGEYQWRKDTEWSEFGPDGHVTIQGAAAHKSIIRVKE